MPRLTAETIVQRGTYVNPLRDREIDLRGLQLPAIENLGVARDAESVDLSDNSIQSCSNLPHLPRVRHLVLANNPVRTISPSLAHALPNLTTLVLTSTELQSLKDLEPIAALPRLELLSLRDTPVSRTPHYRPWLAYRCRSLRILDFEKIKDSERAAGKKLFVDSEGNPTPLAESIGTAPAATFDVDGGDTRAGRLLSAEEKARVKDAIDRAGSVEEVRRLQRMLADGFVPTERDLAPA